MTLSGRIKSITAASTRAGKGYFKITVDSRADGREKFLYLWNVAIIGKFALGKDYDFDVDYSDKEMKYLAINDATEVTYADADMQENVPFDVPQKPIETHSPRPEPRTPPAHWTQGSGKSKDNDIHIIRESALKSASVFLARPTADEKYNEDDLIYVASKLEDYIKNGYVG